MNILDIQHKNITDRDAPNIINKANIITNKGNEDQKIIPSIRKRKSKKERSDRECKKSKMVLRCLYCSTILSVKYAFCPECGNAVPKNIKAEDLNFMQKKYKELEKSNQDLEQKLQLYQQRQQLCANIQREKEQFTDLMWIVASIPKPQFNTEKIGLKDYTIRKISPAFSEFLGFQDSKPLINSKMAKILPNVPSQISQIHSDYVREISLKEDSVSYYKEEVFKNLYDELYLSNIQFTLYTNEKKPSLCIIVLTGLTKVDNLDCVLPNLRFPFVESSDSQDI